MQLLHVGLLCLHLLPRRSAHAPQCQDEQSSGESLNVVVGVVGCDIVVIVVVVVVTDVVVVEVVGVPVAGWGANIKRRRYPMARKRGADLENSAVAEVCARRIPRW